MSGVSVMQSVCTVEILLNLMHLELGPDIIRVFARICLVRVVLSVCLFVSMSVRGGVRSPGEVDVLVHPCI